MMSIFGLYELLTYQEMIMVNIIINIVIDIILSAVFAFIMSKVFKKPKYHLPYNRAIIGSSFFVSVILYFIDTYIFIPGSIPIVSLLIKFVAVIIVAICLCFVEWFMFAEKSENDKVLKKVLTLQTVCWFVFEVVCKIIISFLREWLSGPI